MLLPSFFCVKFGLGVAGSILAMISALLVGYWKLSEYLLTRKMRNPAS